MCIQGRGGDTGSKCLGTSVVSQIEHLCGRLELGRRWVCGRITSWAAVRIGQQYNIAGCGDAVAFDTVNPKLLKAMLLLFLRSSVSTESTLKVIGIIQVLADGLSFLFFGQSILHSRYRILGQRILRSSYKIYGQKNIVDMK